jgi:hypothetical protein
VIKQRKRNIIGCYLGKDLQHVRLAFDVFQRCSVLLESSKLGPARPPEKPFPEKLSEGVFYPHEDEQILAYFFSHWNGQEETEYIRSISNKDLQVLSERLKRPVKTVQKHWDVIIRPTLLSYYNQTLLVSNRKNICEYLIRNKVKSLKMINWDDLLKLYPCENTTSLSNEICRVVSYFEKVFPGFEHLPLYEKLSRTEFKWKSYKLNQRFIQNRKRIIETYLQVFGKGSSN